MVDSYLDWAMTEGVPVYEGFGIDMLAIGPFVVRRAKAVAA